MSFFLSFFLSLTLFFRLIPWNIEALCVHFPAWASKTWTGRRCASSLPGETGRAPAGSVNRASPLSWDFIGFLCKPRNISFSSFLFHSFADAVSPEGSPGSCGGWTPAKALLAKKNEETITMEATNSNIARILIGLENHYSLRDNFQRLKANSMFLSSTIFQVCLCES